MNPPDFFEDSSPVTSNETPDFFNDVELQKEKTPDFFSDIEQKKEKTPDFFSDVEEPSKSSPYVQPGTPEFDDMSYWERSKNFFKGDSLGKAASMQIQSGGFSGAPAATPAIAKKVATEVATIAAVEAAFVPILGAAGASLVAPRVLTSLANLTRAGATGAATATTGSLVETGELPSKEEVIKNGLTWMALDVGIRTLTSSAEKAYEFGSAVNKIAKEDNIPATEVLGKLWDATKNYVRSKFNRNIDTAADITIEDVQLLVDRTKQAEEKGLSEAIEVEGIDVTPAKKVPTEVAKPTETVKPIVETKADTKTKLDEVEQPQDIDINEFTVDELKIRLKQVNDKESTFIKKHLGDQALAEWNRARVKFDFWDKWGDKLTKKQVGSFEKLSKFDSADAEFRLDRFQDIENAFNRFENKSDKIKEVVTELTNELMNLQDPSNSRLLEHAFDKLKSIGTNENQIVQAVKKMIYREFSPEDAKFIAESFDKTKPKPVETKTKTKPEVRHPSIRDLPETIYRGYGRKDKGSVYSDVKSPVLGEGKYFSFDKEATKEFGPKVETKELNLKNPLVITSDDEWKSFLDKTKVSQYNPYDVQSEEKTLNNIEMINDQIKKSGHDGVVVWFPETVYDIVNGKSIKLIRKIFGRAQVYELPKSSIESPSKPVPEELALRPAKEPAEPKETPKEAQSKKQSPPRSTQPRQPVRGKKQAVARSKILKLFRKAFKDPIRIGKIAQRTAAAIHKPWPKVTRLLKDNDIEGAAHEIGHNLHTTLYGENAVNPKQQARMVESALRPFLDELKPLAHYEPWGMEGFAEFTRMYVTNPDVAKELAPKFYAKFENDVRAQYPEMLNALLEAREYYDTYLKGTPLSRIRAQTSYASDRGKLENIIDSLKENFDLDKLNTDFLDDVYPSKRLVAEAFGIPINEVENLKDPRNLYRALRLLKSGPAKGDVFLLHQTFNAKTLEKINGSLKDILDQVPDEETYREFNDYVIARKVIEKSGQGIETGIHIGDAISGEAELVDKYGKLAKELDKYSDSLLQYAKDSGLISSEQYKLIKENNLLHVPFHRVMEKKKNGGGVGSSIQARNPLKRMTGSASDIIAPIESIIKNTYSIILNSEKNLVGQVLAELAATKKNIGSYVEKIPTPIKLKGKVEGEEVSRQLAKRFEEEGLLDLIEKDGEGNTVLRADIADAVPEVFLRFGAGKYPAGENIVTVFDKGKPVYYEVSPAIFEMWTQGISPYIAGLIVKILRIPAKTLRAGAVLNPRFWQKNIFRDTMESWLFTKYGKDVKDPAGLFIDTVYSPLAMLAVAAKRSDLYIEWMKSGGSMSTMQSIDRVSVEKKLDEIRHGIKRHQVIKWIRFASEISEEANRLAEFGRALEVEGKTRLGKEIAAFAARDLSVDFAKMGLKIKAINQVSSFFNVTLQGTNKLWRMMASKEDRPEAIARLVAFIAIPSLILAWLNKDDENIKEFHEEEKDSNFIIEINGNYIKLPVPFLPGVIVHGLTQRMFNSFMKKDPEAFEGFMGSIASAVLPNYLPTITSPFAEVAANKNFFTGAPIIPRAQEDLISKYQYKRTTSQTARLLGRAMSYMLGQDTRNKAASPAVIDHFINGWSGGLGRLMIQISDASLEKAGLVDKIPGPYQSITERFGLNAFSTRFPRANTRSIDKFYDNYADATTRKKSLKYAEKQELESDEELDFSYERFDKMYDYNTLKNGFKAMQLCQREINEIWIDPEIEPKLKRQMIDDLYMQMIQFARVANEDIKTYRLAQ